MGLHYVIGYAPNAALKKQFAACISQAAKRYEAHVKEDRPEVEARIPRLRDQQRQLQRRKLAGQATAHHLPSHRRTARSGRTVYRHQL